MKKELYCGFDSNQFNKIRDLLDMEGIGHKYKIVDSSTRTELVIAGLRSLHGDMTKQYYIFVSDKDFEKSQWLMKN